MSKSPISLKWSSITEEGENFNRNNVPKSRHKLAACLHKSAIYVCGGKEGNVTFKDMWKYDLALCTWNKIKDEGERPPPLHGHTMLGYKDELFVFGGDYCFAGSEETPLWIFNLNESKWTKYECQSINSSPSSRRFHSMVHFNGSLFVYGGFIDLKGSASQLWEYNIAKKCWQLLYNGGTCGPGARHSHNCAVYDNTMWLFGGMTGLQSKTDVWRWHFGTKQWQKMKLRSTCPELVEHSAVQVNGNLFVYGGLKESTPHNELWMFHFNTLTWQKLSSPTSFQSPAARSHHTAVLLNPLHLQSPPHTPKATCRIKSLPNVKKENYSNLFDSEVLTKRPRSSPASHNKSEDFSRQNMFHSKLSSQVIPEMLTSVSSNTSAHEQLQHYYGDNSDSNFSYFESVEMDIFRSKEMDKSAVIKKSEYDNLSPKEANQSNDSKSCKPGDYLNSEKKLSQQKRFLRRRQSTSVDSLFQDYSSTEGNPLLKRQRSKTIGNLSVDSDIGIVNPGYLDSSANSDLLSRLSSMNSECSNGSIHYTENSYNTSMSQIQGDHEFFNNESKHINEKPYKKVNRKYISQFSNDFEPVIAMENAGPKKIYKKHRKSNCKKSFSMDSIADKHVQNNTVSSGKALSAYGNDIISSTPASESLISSNNSNYYNNHFAELSLHRSKSYASNDLKLLDIEDISEHSEENNSSTVENSPSHSCPRKFNRSATFSADESFDSKNMSMSSFDDGLSFTSQSLLLGNDFYSKHYNDYNGCETSHTNPFLFSDSGKHFPSFNNIVKPAWAKQRNITNEDVEMNDLQVERQQEKVLLRSYSNYSHENSEVPMELEVITSKNVISNPETLAFTNGKYGREWNFHSRKSNAKNTNLNTENDCTKDENYTAANKSENKSTAMKKSASAIVSINYKKVDNNWSIKNYDHLISDESNEFEEKALDENWSVKSYGRKWSTPTHFVMIVLGGKEIKSNFSIQPLSMWRLEIRFT